MKNINAPSATVLIADDEPEIQNMMKRYLTSHGYQTLMASDGQEALGKARVQNPAIVLLDVNMPKMNGFDVCQKLREDPATRLLPILMLTARASTEDKVHGLRNGADDYLSKPFEMDELEARIETLLNRTRKMISVNPLTQLPGSPTIQDEIQQRINAGKKFGIAYIDIDNFKAYNDAYGYDQGDKVIRWTASMIQDVVRQADRNAPFDHFLGHIGGDDFVLIVQSDAIRVVSEMIAAEFDSKRDIWYNFWHSLRKQIEVENRRGQKEKFPLMSLSIAISTNEQRKITHPGEMVHVASEMKKFVKNRADQSKSCVAADRRKF